MAEQRPTLSTVARAIAMGILASTRVPREFGFAPHISDKDLHTIIRGVAYTVFSMDDRDVLDEIREMPDRIVEMGDLTDTDADYCGHDPERWISYEGASGAWRPAEGSTGLKECPCCRKPALEGQTSCTHCGAEPADDQMWRDVVRLRAELEYERSMSRIQGLTPTGEEARDGE